MEHSVFKRAKFDLYQMSIDIMLKHSLKNISRLMVNKIILGDILKNIWKYILK